jgi:hypothetical protein
MIEGATKQLLKTLFLRKSSSKKAKELEEQIQKVNKQRAQIFLQDVTKYEFDGSECQNPWQTELLPDESDPDLNPLDDNIPEEQEHSPHWSAGLDPRDSKPTLPLRESSDLDISSSTSVDDSQHMRTQDKQSPAVEGSKHTRPQDEQSSGESASQVLGAATNRTRPAITAEEPDDLLPGMAQAANIEC